MTQESGAESSTPISTNFFNGHSQAEVENALTGHNPHTFRVAQAVYEEPATPSVRVEAPTERTVDDMIALEPSFTQHETVIGQPFTATYLKLDKVYDHLELSEKAHVQVIDKYIAKAIDSNRMIDSASSAVSLIKKLEQKVGLNENHDPYYKAEKLARYINALGDYNKQLTIKPRIVKQSTPKPAVVNKPENKQVLLKKVVYQLLKAL